MAQTQFLSADQATAELGISKGTLYSYVSRGLIRSVETEGTSRERHYLAEDVQALKIRKERRVNPARSAATALDFGDPVMESSLTLISDGRLFYRGHDVLKLADEHLFEEVVALLWVDNLAATHLFDGLATAGHAQQQQMRAADSLLKNLTAVEAFQILLPLAEVGDLASHDLSAPAVAQTGVRLLSLMLLAATGSPSGVPVGRSLQVCWAPATPQAEKMLNAALVLCADHELNASSFSARCIASTGATPYGAVMGGIAALQGPRHGGGTVRCETFVRDATDSVRQAIINRLKLEDRLPGFGHRLYPNGDPRGKYLVDLVLAQFPDAPLSATLSELAGEIERSFGLHPTLDLGLVALSQALDLPTGASLTIFALGRLAGWIGHIIEQYESDQTIRPRARYTGHLPSTQ